MLTGSIRLASIFPAYCCENQSSVTDTCNSASKKIEDHPRPPSYIKHHRARGPTCLATCPAVPTKARLGKTELRIPRHLHCLSLKRTALTVKTEAETETGALPTMATTLRDSPFRRVATRDPVTMTAKHPIEAEDAPRTHGASKSTTRTLHHREPETMIQTPHLREDATKT